MRRFIRFTAICAALLLVSAPVLAAGTGYFNGPALAGIPVEFILFAVVLFFIAFVPLNTMATALAGAAVISLYKIMASPFAEGTGLAGFMAHAVYEWVTLGNLLLLLLGFALLARHFEKSRLPAILPKYMPDDWRGGFVLLVAIFVMSSFLDNIAAAMIGGTVAHTVFRGRVHIGYLAAIVAASNAGGAGSVLGDTTTTMMWIAGVAPTEVLEAYIAACTALLVTAIPASFQQHAWSPIQKDALPSVNIDWPRVAIVGLILGAAIGANLLLNLKFNAWVEVFPFLGLAVWLAILLSAPLRRPDWQELPGAFKGAIFLLALVWSASMMPVEKLPPASWQNALSLGFVSSVFDNIPLTALALKQGGFDWGFLAYAVGFGGSMIWFGSSAGVALSNMYPEAKSVTNWLRHGWHVVLAYVVGFFVMLAVWDWHPGSKLRGAAAQSEPAAVVVPAANAGAAPNDMGAGTGLKMPGTNSAKPRLSRID